MLRHKPKRYGSFACGPHRGWDERRANGCLEWLKSPPKQLRRRHVAGILEASGNAAFRDKRKGLTDAHKKGTTVQNGIAHNKLGLKVTLLSLSFLMATDFVFIPASNEVFNAFADASPAILNFILTGSLFTAIAGALTGGFLAKKVCKKHLLIGSQIAFVIGGCCGALVENVYYIAFMRGLVGFSFGLTGALAVSFIAELFEDEKERSTMIGGYNAAIAAFGIVASIVAGRLAAQDWHNAFYVYGFAAIVLVMMVIFLPKTAPEGDAPAADRAASDEKIPVAKLAAVTLAAMAFEALYCVLVYFLAIYLGEINVGDASTAGMFLSLVSVGQFLSGFVFAFAYAHLHRSMPVAFFLLAAAVYGVLAFTTNSWLIGAAVVLIGVTNGCAMSYYYMHVETIVPASHLSVAMAIVLASLNLGGFLSSYLLTGCQALLGATTIAPTFGLIALTLLAGALISAALTLRAKKRDANEAAEAVEEA